MPDLSVVRKSNMPTLVNIYALIDPRNGRIRYVGKTKHPPRVRVRQHVADAKAGKMLRVHRWIRALLRAGVAPEVMCIASVSEDFWPVAEQTCIDYLKNSGHDLTNLNNGGIGMHNPSQETRDKLRATRLGTRNSPESNAKRSKTLRGRKQTAEHVEKRTRGAVGRRLSAAHRSKISKALKGSSMSEESKRKSGKALRKLWKTAGYREKQLSRVCSDETRIKMSVAHTGKEASLEHRMKISQALKGRPKSKQHKSRLAEAQKLAYAQNRSGLNTVNNLRRKQA